MAWLILSTECSKLATHSFYVIYVLVSNHIYMTATWASGQDSRINVLRVSGNGRQVSMCMYAYELLSRVTCSLYIDKSCSSFLTMNESIKTFNAVCLPKLFPCPIAVIGFVLNVLEKPGPASCQLTNPRMSLPLWLCFFCVFFFSCISTFSE